MSTNPYETYAHDFIRHRGGQPKGIGQKTVRRWADQLPPNARVLDLGCGTGWPISLALTEAGLTLYGLELSSTLFTAFQQNFPQAHSRCEDIRFSDFFAQQFEGIVAWGGSFFVYPPRTTSIDPKNRPAPTTQRAIFVYRARARTPLDGCNDGASPRITR